MSLGAKIRLKILLELSKNASLANIIHVLENKKTKEAFVFNGEQLDYLFHSYNNLGLTERSVEIPIVKHYLTRKKWSNVLEIGNVTNYYEDYFSGLFPNKTIVDKIERNYNVITSDIANFFSPNGFDFIFSISTFEHMDSDLGRNLDHVPGIAKNGTVAADNIVHCYENLLEKDGLMVITAPLGYTPEWDSTFRDGILDKYPFKGFKKQLISRVSEQNWVQTTEFDADNPHAYGTPFPYANHIAIVEISK